MEGELEIEDAYGIKLSDELTTSQKVQQVFDWISQNFEPYGLHSFDFYEWDNEFELDGEIVEQSLSATEILDEFFLDDLSPKERKLLKALLDKECLGDDRWIPHGVRVEVVPIDEAVPDYDELVSKIPSILKDLEIIKGALSQIGSNGAPGTEFLTADYISSLQDDLKSVEKTPKSEVTDKKEFFSDLIGRARRFIKQFSAAFGDQSKIYFDALVKAAGKEAGKSTAQELVKYLTANGRFSNWVDALKKFLEDWFQ